MAARLGLEPKQTEPESVVLPLHYRANLILNMNTKENFSREILQK